MTPIYKIFLNARCKLTDFEGCSDKDIDDICTQLEVPIIYKLRFRKAIRKYNRENVEAQAPSEPAGGGGGTYVLDKSEKNRIEKY